MKKFIALLLALVMVMGLVACGAPAGNEGGEVAATKVSVFWYDEADVYLSTVRASRHRSYASHCGFGINSLLGNAYCKLNAYN